MCVRCVFSLYGMGGFLSLVRVGPFPSENVFLLSLIRETYLLTRASYNSELKNKQRWMGICNSQGTAPVKKRHIQPERADCEPSQATDIWYELRFS